MESPYAQSSDQDSLVLSQMQHTAQEMSTWLKILGIAYIVIGVPTALALVGVLYIWLGWMLYKAGEAAQRATGPDLVTMMDKFKTYFLVMAILTILGVVMMIIYLIVLIGLVTMWAGEGGFPT
jgi:hypothetical protein